MTSTDELRRRLEKLEGPAKPDAVHILAEPGVDYQDVAATVDVLMRTGFANLCFGGIAGKPVQVVDGPIPIPTPGVPSKDK